MKRFDERWLRRANELVEQSLRHDFNVMWSHVKVEDKPLRFKQKRGVWSVKTGYA